MLLASLFTPVGHFSLGFSLLDSDKFLGAPVTVPDLWPLATFSPLSLRNRDLPTQTPAWRH